MRCTAITFHHEHRHCQQLLPSSPLTTTTITYRHKHHHHCYHHHHHYHTSGITYHHHTGILSITTASSTGTASTTAYSTLLGIKENECYNYTQIISCETPRSVYFSNLRGCMPQHVSLDILTLTGMLGGKEGALAWRHQVELLNLTAAQASLSVLFFEFR